MKMEQVKARFERQEKRTEELKGGLAALIHHSEMQDSIISVNSASLSEIQRKVDFCLALEQRILKSRFLRFLFKIKKDEIEIRLMEISKPVESEPKPKELSEKEIEKIVRPAQQSKPEPEPEQENNLEEDLDSDNIKEQYVVE